jgi:hypothetical protein
MKPSLLELAEPLTWESTTPAYTRWITDSRYRKLRPYARKWYRPACPRCAALRASNTNKEQE